jgi:outer membrane protein TolC
LSLTLVRRVSEAYWRLWKLRRTQDIHRDHLGVLQGLSETVRARLMTGSATLADQQQIDLAAARLEDRLRAMAEAERVAAARLAALLSLPADSTLPTTVGPGPPELPAKTEAELRALAMEHPLLDAYVMLIQSDEAEARSRQAEGYPSFSLGLDWIITGEADAPNVPDSGKDAIAITGGIGLPLWRGNYEDAASAARADKRAHEAQLVAARDAALAELRSSSSSVREGARRVNVYESTLIPQADAAYSSVLGAYATGRGSVAATLLSQSDLLQLRIELEEIRAEHAAAWARLEEVVGSRLERRAVGK